MLSETLNVKAWVRQSLSWINPAGGPRYHWAALRNQHQWTAHVHAVANWLTRWSPTAERLLLIGPSAGYSLRNVDFSRFRSIDVLEPDPVARWLFRAQFRNQNIPIQFLPGDYFCQHPLHLWPDGILYLKDEYPDHALLFCNFLGQLPLLYRNFEGDCEPFARNLKLVLRESEWSSYHDLWSCQGSADLWPSSFVNADGSFQNLAGRFFSQPPLELIDHQSTRLIPRESQRYIWGWQIRENQFHCVEGARSSL